MCKDLELISNLMPKIGLCSKLLGINYIIQYWSDSVTFYVKKKSNLILEQNKLTVVVK